MMEGSATGSAVPPGLDDEVAKRLAPVTVQASMEEAEAAAASLAQHLEALGLQLAPVLAQDGPLPVFSKPEGLAQPGVAALTTRASELGTYLAQCTLYVQALQQQLAI